jgi:beta-lactam-binding protein with PASTA domain
VALKVLFPEYAKDATFVARFRREAQAAARLNHPNIVGVYDWGEETGTYFIAMEYIEGRTLSEIVRAEGPLHPRRAAEATADVAAALGFAHRNGVIHRDVKPGNVMCETSGLIKVADFGIAQAIGGPEQTQLTRVGSVMGTATYFSPEQAQGKQVDPRSDIYSLGCVLFEILTGRPPFSGETPVAIAYKHVQEAPPKPSSITQVPPGLDAIVLKCLAKTPDGRYSSAEELRTDLRRFLEGQPVAALAGAAAAGAAAGFAAGDATAAYAGTPTGTNPAYGDATSAMPVTGGHAYPPPGATGMTGAAPPYGGPPPGKKKPPNPWLIGALVLFLLLVAGGLIGLAIKLSGSSAKQVSVPSLIGKRYDDEAGKLRDLKFVVETVPEANAQHPAGEIFNQDPGPNKEVPEGSKLKLWISQGTGDLEVPRVEGLPLDQARQKLVGLDVKETREASDTVEKDKVISQDPAPGKRVRPNSRVTLVVSDGKSQVPVPDVSGQLTATARDTLKGAGFLATNTVPEASNEFQKGRVIRTNPAANQPADKNTPITIYESTGPAPTTTAAAATTTTSPPTTTARTTTTRATTTTTDNDS